jgi:hypothetical protein
MLAVSWKVMELLFLPGDSVEAVVVQLFALPPLATT